MALIRVRMLMFGVMTMLCLAVALWTRAETPLPEATPLTAQEAGEARLHTNTKWLGQALKRIQMVKPGSTRSELLKVFITEGGLSTGLRRTYVYRTCPYIKVDVDFRAVGRLERDAEGRVTLKEDGRDVVVKISNPYLQWTTGD